MTQEFAGGCACGTVRYTMLDEPLFVHCCHCTECQCQTGSAFVLNAMIETDRIRLDGQAPEPFEVPSTSGGLHEIYRCPECLVAVWSLFERRGMLRFVRVGTLDTPSSLPPNIHIYTRSKLPWINLPEDVPAFDEYYDRRKEWPPAALERYRAAAGELM